MKALFTRVFGRKSGSCCWAQAPRRKVQTERPAALHVEILEPRELLSVAGPAQVSNPPALSGHIVPRILDPRATLPDSTVPAVGKVFNGGGSMCTGSLISPNWVLTAKHCVEGPAVSFADGFGRSYSATSIRKATNTDDLAIFQLNRSISDITPISLSTWAPRLNTLVYLIGYGQTGNGSSGTVAGTQGTKRWGFNYIDYVAPSLVSIRFDRGESLPSYGDSGSSYLSFVNNRWYAVGVQSTNTGFTYGAWSNGVRVDIYASAINCISSGFGCRSGGSRAFAAPRPVASGTHSAQSTVVVAQPNHSARPHETPPAAHSQIMVSAAETRVAESRETNRLFTHEQDEKAQEVMGHRPRHRDDQTRMAIDHVLENESLSGLRVNAYV